MAESTQTYKGVNVTLSTVQAADGTWIGRADVPVEGQQMLTLKSRQNYDSEQDARKAAFSLAANTIDGMRTRKGKL